jgi:glutaminyl-tRNA synthetase
VPAPDEIDEGKDFTSSIDPDSLQILTGIVEPCLRSVRPGDRFQFLRVGYFCADPDSTPERPVFNRTVTLQDSWAKIMAKGKENE